MKPCQLKVLCELCQLLALFDRSTAMQNQSGLAHLYSFRLVSDIFG